MKNINQYISETERLSSLDDYILEKFKLNSKNLINEKPINILVKYFKEIILIDKDYKFKESDFKDYKTGMYKLDIDNISMNYLQFIKKIKEEDDNQFQYDGDIKKDGEYSIGIIGQDETCLTFNFIDRNFKICASIQEIDVSKDIKDILINKK